MFGAIREGKPTSAQFMADWAENVKKNIPKDQFLEFDVKKGWQPLCEFLGLPSPETPFPRANDREQMMKEINKVT